MKKLKLTTTLNYSPHQLWNAVFLRTDKFRLEPGGSIYIDNGEHYSYWASFDFDRKRAVDALLEVDAIDLTDGAYQRLCEYFNVSLPRGVRQAQG